MNGVVAPVIAAEAAPAGEILRSRRNVSVVMVTYFTGEALTDDFKAYAAQIIRNAQALAQAFQDKGYRVVSGGTDNHLLVLDLRPQGLNGTKATRLLDANHITISKSTLPYDTEKILHGGGIRIGTPAVTTRGMAESDMQTVADLIDRALKGEDVKAEVHAFAGGFPIP